MYFPILIHKIGAKVLFTENSHKDKLAYAQIFKNIYSILLKDQV